MSKPSGGNGVAAGFWVQNCPKTACVKRQNGCRICASPLFKWAESKCRESVKHEISDLNHKKSSCAAAEKFPGMRDAVTDLLWIIRTTFINKLMPKIINAAEIIDTCFISLDKKYGVGHLRLLPQFYRAVK